MPDVVVVNELPKNNQRLPREEEGGGTCNCPTIEQIQAMIDESIIALMVYENYQGFLGVTDPTDIAGRELNLGERWWQGRYGDAIGTRWECKLWQGAEGWVDSWVENDYWVVAENDVAYWVDTDNQPYFATFVIDRWVHTASVNPLD